MLTGKDPIVSSFYDIVERRRDVRAEFTGAPIDEDVLRRILTAAHAAPSVGLTQPWDFIVVRDRPVREAFREHVLTERDSFADQLSGEQTQRLGNIKIEGILDASIGLVVTYDQDRGAPAVLGRHAIADAGLYSVCLAIQNLWLAATAEDIGVGWVSFYREDRLRELLGIPERIRPVAWLCLGPVSQLQTVPDLERHKWRTRMPPDGVLHGERYGQPMGWQS
ncbi:MAG: 5,6-dimethylbenzimidazole synthase [Jatrophihabitans sp.]